MNRIYHTWDKWECYLAGFYNTRSSGGLSKDESEEIYRKFLSNSSEFEEVLKKIISEWKYSCEHYLTNENMNRIAWLGQACLAYKFEIPSCYRGGYNLLEDDEKIAADNLALKYLNIWMVNNNYPEYTTDNIKSKTQANIY